MFPACAADPARAVRVAAPAKVNLYLGVHRELDERGYHLVDSVMASLGLADEVEVAPTRGLSVACDPDAGCPAHKNTCWKAVEAMDAEFGVGMGFAVRVTRRVPNQAGLGGSSSDAAATLVGVCDLCGIDSRDPRVAAVARRVVRTCRSFLPVASATWMAAETCCASRSTSHAIAAAPRAWSWCAPRVTGCPRPRPMATSTATPWMRVRWSRCLRRCVRATLTPSSRTSATTLRPWRAACCPRARPRSSGCADRVA